MRDIEVWVSQVRFTSTMLTLGFQLSHPLLSEVKKEPPSRGLPGTVISILDIGAPVLGLLKQVLDKAGVVPFLNPVLSAVMGLFQATQVCVKCPLSIRTIVDIDPANSIQF
jgi:hypothetical protein